MDKLTEFNEKQKKNNEMKSKLTTSIDDCRKAIFDVRKMIFNQNSLHFFVFFFLHFYSRNLIS